VKRLGLIGCGRIGSQVVQASRDGLLPGWHFAGVLTRSISAPDFFNQKYDLIIEAAGAQALAQHGARALALADVWTVSGAALADPNLFDLLETTASKSGHRLRLVAGAIAGLDGVAAAAVDPAAELELSIDLPPGEAAAGVVFAGSVREAAVRFPEGVNVAVAAALAGPGLERSRIEVLHPAGSQHRLALTARSRYGALRVETEPRVSAGAHPVAASLIAALRRELQAVWAG
jgi:aspartate dehydrogenase